MLRKRFLATVTCLAIGSLASLSSVSQAQETVGLDPLFACQEITAAEDRLACYDSAVRALQGNGEEIVAVRRSEVEAVERDSFGLELPSLPRLSLSLFERRENQLQTGEATETASASSSSSNNASASDTEDQDARILERDSTGQIDQLALAIDRVERVGFESVRIHTRNGQVWETSDRVGSRPFRVRDDSVMIVRRAAIGSYLMQIDGRGRAYRVQRIR